VRRERPRLDLPRRHSTIARGRFRRNRQGRARGGIVEYDIDATGTRANFVEETDHGCGIADVPGRDERALRVRTHLRSSRLERQFPPSNEENLKSVPQKRQRRRSPDAAPCAGDQCYSFDHGVIPSGRNRLPEANSDLNDNCIHYDMWITCGQGRSGIPAIGRARGSGGASARTVETQLHGCYYDNSERGAVRAGPIWRGLEERIRQFVGSLRSFFACGVPH
jgi:hypothetical protein